MPISADALSLGYEAHDPSLVDQTETANDNTNTSASLIKDLQSDSSDFLDETEGDARYAQKSNNLSDMTAVTMRTNLGLGDSATKDVGTGSGEVAAGNHTHSGFNFSGPVTNFTVVNGIVTAAS